jgi:hypothetical protein
MNLFKKNEPKVEEQQLSEQMQISELDDTSSNSIVDIFNKINEISMVQKLDFNTEIESSIRSIKEETKKAIFGPLTAQARTLDECNRTVFSLSRELVNSEHDIRAKSAKEVPTPFIKRYVKNLERQYYQIDETIKSVAASYNRNNELANESPEFVLAMMLKKEHDAVVRCSSKLQKLKSQFDYVSSEYEKNFKISDKIKGEYNASLDYLGYRFDTAETVSTQYNAFVAENKKRVSENIEKMDMFGELQSISTVPAKSGFSFNSAKVTPSATQATSGRPKANAPPPIKTGSATL